MTVAEDRIVEQAVRDALGGVGVGTAFDHLPPELEAVARARYHQRVAELGAESGGHAQSVEPALRGSA